MPNMPKAKPPRYVRAVALVTPDEHKQWSKRAAALRLSLSELIRQAVETHLTQVRDRV